MQCVVARPPALFGRGLSRGGREKIFIINRDDRIVKRAAEQQREPLPAGRREQGEERGVLDRCVLYVLRGAILDAPWCVCKNWKGDEKHDE